MPVEPGKGLDHRVEQRWGAEKRIAVVGQVDADVFSDMGTVAAGNE